MRKSQTYYLQRCLELAARGEGWVSPNPMVGSVIVRSGRIVGEGFHRRFGSAHAEVEALREAGKRARGATLYVNLEPCAHYGKTPPCVRAIIEAGISTVVASCLDPNPLVRGKGFRALRKAGVHVLTGEMKREAESLNQKFLKFMETRLPYVAVKVAQTLDGRSADVRGASKWITSESSRKESHRIRSHYDAILVGANTVRIDNPELTVRGVRGRNPLRVILDPRMTTLPDSKVFNTSEAETLVVTSARSMTRNARRVRALNARGVKLLGLDENRVFEPGHLLTILSALGISSVLVEGGPSTISRFLSERLVDKVHWFVAPALLGGGLSSFVSAQPLRLSKSIVLKDTTTRLFGSDILIEGQPRYR